MKKICFLLICTSFLFLGISADSKTDKESKLLKQKINEIKNKMNKTEATKKTMAELQEDIKSTDVLDENTVKAFEEASQLMDSVSEIIKLANISLLKAEISEGDLRTSEIKNANKQHELANEKLYKIQLLLAMIADKAKLIERITQIVSNLKTLNQNLIGQIEKELSGEKKNLEFTNDLADKQLKITKSIILLENNLSGLIKRNANQAETELILKVANLLSEDKTTSKSKDLESKIENNDLFVADFGQKEIIKTMLNALKILSPENELVKDPSNEKDPAHILTHLLPKIASQNIKIGGVIDTSTGNPDITSDPNYDPTLVAQNGLNTDIKKDTSNLPLSPESKIQIDTAIKASEKARQHLENGEPQKAIEENNKATTAIAKAIEAENKNTAENKKNPEKGNQSGKDDPNQKDNPPGKNNKPEIADLNLSPLDENQKAAKFAIDFDQVKIRQNILKLGDGPQEKEVWLAKSTEKNKAILLQSLVDSAPKEYADHTKRYFEVISTIGE